MLFTGDLRGADFTGRNLAGAVFRGADLYRADFTAARLERAVLADVFAAEAVFDRAQCAAMQATGSSFFRARFRGADLTGALLWKCVLAGADLRGARLKGLGVSLECSSFEGVELDRAAAAELARLVRLARAPLRERWRELSGRRTRAGLGPALHN